MAQGRQLVLPQPATPAVTGLLIACDINVPTDNDGRPARWQEGIEWRPEQVYDFNTYGLENCGETSGMASTSPLAVQTADPFVVMSKDQCSTFGFQRNDYEARARRSLAANLEGAIGYEFQRGQVRDSLGLGNVALKDAIQLNDYGGTPASIVNALAALEWEMASGWFNGRRGMIHCDMQLLAMLKGANLIFQAGQKWLTAAGNIVVASPGYSTDSVGSTGNGHWLYGTLPVEVTLGDVLIVPENFETAMSQGMNRATNLVEVWAQQLVLIRVQGTWSNVPGVNTAENADLMLKIEVDTP